VVQPLTSSQPGIKGLKIPQSDPNATIYVEYRQPIGADIALQAISGSNVFDGVLIRRRYSGTDNVPDTILLDASPPTDAKTAALLPGKSLSIPGTNVTISALSKTAAGFQVRVTIAGTVEPSISPTTAPSQAPTAQPTAASGSTRLAFSVFLHGIGLGGDNVSPAAISAGTPAHLQRSVRVDLYNSSNQLITTKQGTLTYTPAAGNFQAVVDMGTLPTSLYLIKVSVDHYLHKLLPGIQQITSGTLNTIPAVALVTGDATNDNLINIFDYNTVIDCFSDLSAAKNCSDPNKKQAADLTDDGSVNQFDYNLFLRELSVQSGQ
jgi:hypothetical protein